jgi:hypothetical protein
VRRVQRSRVVRRYKRRHCGACNFICRGTLALTQHPRGIGAWIKSASVHASRQACRRAPEPSRQRRRVRSLGAASLPRPRTRPCEPAKRCVPWGMVGNVTGDGGRRPHPVRCHHSRRAVGFGYCGTERTCSDAIDVSSESFSLGVIVTCGAAFKRRTLVFTKHSPTPPATAACLLHRWRLHWRGWRDDGWHDSSCAGSWLDVSWHEGS